MSLRYYVVSRYEVADGPGKNGKWRIFARAVLLANLGRTLAKLRARGYSEASISVEDRSTGEDLPEDQWPKMEKS